MKSEESIRAKLARLEKPPYLFKEEGGPNLIPTAVVGQFVSLWVRKYVLGDKEYEDTIGFYCAKHGRPYLQDIAVGDTGAGCPICKEESET